MEIIGVVLITIFIGICCSCISQGINKQLGKELKELKKLNKQLLGLYQNEKSKTDTLYRILKYIKSQLSLLGLPECPKEELKNIPFEIVGWIEQLIIIEENRDNGIYK